MDFILNTDDFIDSLDFIFDAEGKQLDYLDGSSDDSYPERTDVTSCVDSDKELSTPEKEVWLDEDQDDLPQILADALNSLSLGGSLDSAPSAITVGTWCGRQGWWTFDGRSSSLLHLIAQWKTENTQTADSPERMSWPSNFLLFRRAKESGACVS